MTIKTRFTPLTLIAIFPLMLAISCQSHEQKTNDAFDLVKEEKMLNKDSIELLVSDTGKAINKGRKNEVPKRMEYSDIWNKFKIDTERKILANENRIKEIKGLPDRNIRIYKQITGLETENTNLRAQMNDYSEEVKNNLEKFMKKMEEEIRIINSELNDISAMSKK